MHVVSAPETVAGVTEALSSEELLADDPAPTAAPKAEAAPPADDPQARAGQAPSAEKPERAGEAGNSAEIPRRLRSVFGPAPAVGVLGIDDQRRGSRGFHKDPDSGQWVADADCWQTVFIDSTGGHGLLGAVEGRAKAPVIAWILAQPPAWRARIWAVTIDLSTLYRAAAREALPHAIILADIFHVAQLATKMVDDVRRRNTHRMRGRRGRVSDLEYTIKNLLRWGPSTLSRRSRRKILETLSALETVDGAATHEIRTAWTARNLLLEMLALAPSRTGRATTRTDVGRALYRFFDYCATFGRDIPELVTLAETIDSWRDEIANAVTLGITNAAAEGVNRLSKLIYRVAFGLRNVVNQQRRARYIAYRATRPDWQPTVTAYAKVA
ncbi:transposase [Frankia sp. Cppng1_Ct_nod]|uniref:transposase n=1 Tax=Frankia sp. Cppng1_Ct_nod TaxID=2897162 RepID=UPI0032E9F375